MFSKTRSVGKHAFGNHDMNLLDIQYFVAEARDYLNMAVLAGKI